MLPDPYPRRDPVTHLANSRSKQEPLVDRGDGIEESYRASTVAMDTTEDDPSVGSQTGTKEDRRYGERSACSPIGGRCSDSSGSTVPPVLAARPAVECVAHGGASGRSGPRRRRSRECGTPARRYGRRGLRGTDGPTPEAAVAGLGAAFGMAQVSAADRNPTVPDILNCALTRERLEATYYADALASSAGRQRRACARTTATARGSTRRRRRSPRRSPGRRWRRRGRPRSRGRPPRRTPSPC